MRGKKRYWYINVLPILFLPMSILAVIIMVGELKFFTNNGSFSSEFWPNFFEYHFVYWMILFYPAYYLFCWRRSLRMTGEQVQKLIKKMTIVSSILILWSAGTTYAIHMMLTTVRSIP